jgi:hypothetical protein
LALIYAVRETMTGSWSQQDMTAHGASTTQAALELTASAVDRCYR